MSAVWATDAMTQLAEWGEACTFTPANGSARSVVAIIDEDRQIEDNGRSRQQVSTIKAFVLKDKTNETYGGIDDVSFGGTLRRDSLPEREYACTGEASREDPYCWEITFKHRVLIGVAENNRR